MAATKKRAVARLGPAEQWAIALAAPLYVQNHFALDRLGGGSPGQGVAYARSMLRDLTDVDDRRGALALLPQYLDDRGARGAYARRRAWLASLPPESKATGFLFLEGSEHVTTCFVRDHAGQPEELDLTAWDVARLGLYTGLAYRAGYLAEHEAWGILHRAALLARSVYRSWADYASAYLYGRWSSYGSIDASMTELEATVRKLQGGKGPWTMLDWALDLSSLAARTEDPGDPGGPLRALPLRVTAECSACLLSTVLPSPTGSGVRCQACGAPIDREAAEAWALAVPQATPSDDEEDEDGEDGEDEEVEPGQTPDPITDSPLLSCGCGRRIDDAVVRTASGGKITCACGRETSVAPAPELLRSLDFRVRYVVGAPLRVGEPRGVLTLLLSER